MQVQLNTSKPNYNPYFKGHITMRYQGKLWKDIIKTEPEVDKELHSLITAFCPKYETLDNLYLFWYYMEKDRLKRFLEEFSKIPEKFNIPAEQFELPMSVKDSIKHIKAKIEYEPAPFGNFDKTNPSYTIKIGKKFEMEHVFNWDEINNVRSY